MFANNAPAGRRRRSEKRRTGPSRLVRPDPAARRHETSSRSITSFKIFIKVIGAGTRQVGNLRSGAPSESKVTSEPSLRVHHAENCARREGEESARGGMEVTVVSGFVAGRSRKERKEDKSKASGSRMVKHQGAATRGLLKSSVCETGSERSC